MGWKYYYKGPREAYCDSYAGLWREVTGKGYKLIAETRLKPPTDTTGPSVQHQFMYDLPTRVISGDFLGIHVKKTSTCRHHVVSAVGTGRKQLIYSKQIGPHQLVRFEKLDFERKTASIQAKILSE